MAQAEFEEMSDRFSGASTAEGRPGYAKLQPGVVEQARARTAFPVHELAFIAEELGQLKHGGDRRDWRHQDARESLDPRDEVAEQLVGKV